MLKQITPYAFPQTRLTAFAAAVFSVLAYSSVSAQESVLAAPFELGVITVTATKPQIGEIGESQVSSVITHDEMQRFNRDNVGDALNLLSGVTVSNNSRNEKTIFLRGFDVRQAPLFIDGIPVYVPYDGYVDFNRFTTADLAAIQVAKGFSSVSYGPNTLGGAINLISRRPTSAFEGDVKVGFASGLEKQAAVNVGSNQGLWYLQAGASYLDSDYFPLSSDFNPTATEDGGHRENSYRTDSKLSFKVGLTPNATDEYAISYYKQNGEKGNPPSTDPAAARYWQWPFWDKESLYFISNTALGDLETLRVRLYTDKFNNGIDSYTDGSYSVLKKTGPGSVSTGKSRYDDKTNGGSVELESRRIKANTIKLVGHYKVDMHKETDANDQLNADFKDTLRSLSVEDNIELTPNLMLSVGYAHHELTPDSVFNSSSAYSLPKKQSADNPQIGLFFDYSDNVRFYASIAEKSRLPTLKDRYSQRLGSYVENPDLQAEESVNYEIGYIGKPWQNAKAQAAAFYSEIKNKIQSNFIGAVGSSCTNVFKCQMQNVGEVHMSGVELGLSSPITSWLEAGANYTWLDMDNVSNPATKITGIPEQKFTANVLVRPVAQLEVVGYLERDSGQWASNTVKLDGFTTANLKAVYRPAKNIYAEIGVNNLTDKNYSLADGFPNPGRTYFATANYQF